MVEGWEKFLISCVNNCTEVEDKHRSKNVLMPKTARLCVTAAVLTPS